MSDVQGKGEMFQLVKISLCKGLLAEQSESYFTEIFLAF